MELCSRAGLIPRCLSLLGNYRSRCAHPRRDFTVGRISRARATSRLMGTAKHFITSPFTASRIYFSAVLPSIAIVICIVALFFGEASLDSISPTTRQPTAWQENFGKTVPCPSLFAYVFTSIKSSESHVNSCDSVLLSMSQNFLILR